MFFYVARDSMRVDCNGEHKKERNDIGSIYNIVPIVAI